MCLPQDGVTPLPSVAKGRSGSAATSWAVDQRPFVWVAPPVLPSSDRRGAPGHRSKSRKDGLHSTIALPGTADSRSATLTLEALNLPIEDKILLAELWLPVTEGREAAGLEMGPLVCSLPRFGVAHLDIPQPSFPRDVLASLSLSSPRPVALPAVPENLQCSGISSPRSGWDSLDSEGNPVELKRTTTLRKTQHHKATGNSGCAISKKINRANPTKDVSMSDSLSDDEDQSEDDDEDPPAVSQKRLRRMLSNRASAQRSRLRRQERLDTLEVLVAELRVENAALSRNVNSSHARAKRFEDENNVLFAQVKRLSSVPVSDAASLNELERCKTIKNPAGGSLSILGRYSEAPRFDRNCTQESFDSSKSNLDDEPMETSSENTRQQLPFQRWNEYILSGNSDNFDFSSDHMAEAPKPSVNVTASQDIRECHNPDDSSEMRITNLYQPEVMGLAQASSFQDTADPFASDLEHCNQKMDRARSRFREDAWLANLADSMK